MGTQVYTRAGVDQWANSPERKASALEVLGTLPPVATPPPMRVRSMREQNLRQQLHAAEEKARDCQVTADAYKKELGCTNKTLDEYEAAWNKLEAERDTAIAEVAALKDTTDALENKIKVLEAKIKAFTDVTANLRNMGFV